MACPVELLSRKIVINALFTLKVSLLVLLLSLGSFPSRLQTQQSV